MRTIAIINQKGGCGKTTTAINLAGVFARRGKKTLLIDMDPQSHCAAGLAIPEQRIDVQIGDAMLAVGAGSSKTVDWSRLLWRVSRNLDLAPSTVRLAAIEAPRGGLAAADDAEKRLDLVLTRLADQYDICLIDCPPSIGLLTFNALFAASEVIIPVETGFFALQGSAKQVQTIKAMGKKLGSQPPHRIVATMHDEHNPLAREVLDQINDRFKSLVSPVVIRLDSKLREAVSFGQPAIEYAPESTGAQDYTALADWLIRTPAGKKVAVSDSDEPALTPDGGIGQVNVKLGARVPSPRPDPVQEALALAASLRAMHTPGLSPAASVAATASATALAEPPVAAPITPATPSRVRVGAFELIEDEPAPKSPDIDTLRAILGARSTVQGVLFVQPALIGKAVYVAGHFNNWSLSQTPMKLNKQLGVLEALVPLPPGRHEYRLIIDGRWTPDTFNPLATTNPFGESNSYVDVQQSDVRGL